MSGVATIAATDEDVRETPIPPPDRASTAISTAELAECQCPEFCERDHDRD